MTSPKELLTTREAAKMLGRSPRTLERWRRIGHGPRHVPMGLNRGVMYKRAELLRWIDERQASVLAS